MRLHAPRHVPLAALGVTAKLFGVSPAGLADRSRANDRHLAVLGEIGEMGLHASLERGAAGFHLVAALRLDVRRAGLRGWDSANAEWLISRAALSAAMQVKVLIFDSSGCNVRISAQAKSDTLWGRAFLEHCADGVNGFLVRRASRRCRILSSRPSVAQHGAHM